jgi:proteasome lid subunit RPN8/RPN11
VRDLAEFYPRWGRQLLVPGATVEGQVALQGWTAVLAHDTSELARRAAQAAGRYLVGGGLGRLVQPSDWAPGTLDAQVVLLSSPADAAPPLANAWFAERAYGASCDLVCVEAPGAPARVCTVRWLTEGPPSPADGVAIGAAVADVLLAAVLQLEPLPALLTFDWTGPEPVRRVEQRAAEAVLPSPAPPQQRLMAELRSLPEQWQVVVAEAERCYPLEACGLLLRDANGQLRATAAPNLQDRYHALDPDAYPRTARAAYTLNERLIAKAVEAGQTLVGIWHSHCDAGAYFSSEDVRCAAPGGQALYPGVAYLVVSVLGGRLTDAALYHFDDASGNLAAEP